MRRKHPIERVICDHREVTSPPDPYSTDAYALLDAGTFFAPSGYETLFPSLAHTWDEIERTGELQVRRQADSPTID